MGVLMRLPRWWRAECLNHGPGPSPALRAEDGVNVSRHLPVTNDKLAVAGASSHEEVSRRADPT